MHISRLSALAAFSGSALAFPNMLNDPNFQGVPNWKRAPAIGAAAVTTAGTSMTRGSQSNPTDPCYNVYAAPSPPSNPAGRGPDGTLNHGYQPPGTNDVRSPCPALNTLANHGYLPRDGRGINGSTLVAAFANGWGVDESVIAVAKTNALAICGFQSAGAENGATPPPCTNFDLNILNEPHLFEHDHSLSRKDYNQNDRNGPSNNHVFDPAVFNQSIAVLGNSCFMTIPQANEVRLQREVNQYLLDKPYWFTLAPGTQETEVGFIFGVMKNANLTGDQTGANPSVRVDWWQYWFMYESFPTPLGWAPPSPAVTSSFINSVSAAVESAKITSTPSPFATPFIFGPTVSFPATSTPGMATYFNPTLPNLYTATVGPSNMKRWIPTAVPTAGDI